MLLVAVFMLNMAMPAFASAPANASQQIRVPICSYDGEKWVTLDIVLGDENSSSPTAPQPSNPQFECALCYIVAATGMAALQDMAPDTVETILRTEYKIHFARIDAPYDTHQNLYYHGRAPPAFIL